MTLDRILPNYFLKQNKRGSNYRIIISFLILCVSVLFVTGGTLCFSWSIYLLFLAVMGLFGIGNLLLKFKRKKLPRPEKARGIAVVTAVILVIVAFVGNVQLNVDSFYTFIKYLIPSLPLSESC
jgi:peptidoglycan/LPS O-acetylase OafA/YrhL